MRVPAQFTPRFFAAHLQIQRQRFGKPAHCGARVLVGEVFDRAVAAAGTRGRARDLHIRYRGARGRVVDAVRGRLFDCGSVEFGQRIDANGRPAVRSVADDAYRSRVRARCEHADDAAPIAVYDRRPDHDRTNPARARAEHALFVCRSPRGDFDRLERRVFVDHRIAAISVYPGTARKDDRVIVRGDAQEHVEHLRFARDAVGRHGRCDVHRCVVFARREFDYVERFERTVDHFRAEFANRRRSLVAARECGHMMAAPAQFGDHRAADVAAPAGNEDPH